MPFSQIIPPSPLPESESLFYTSLCVSFAVSHAAAAAAKSLQSCLTLCDSIDGSLLG